MTFGTFEEFWNNELAGCYGPFENPIEPYFSLARLAWVKSGEAHAEIKRVKPFWKR